MGFWKACVWVAGVLAVPIAIAAALLSVAALIANLKPMLVGVLS